MPQTIDAQFFKTSPYFRFAEGVALLGAGTNGAQPQRIYGLFVESHAYEFDGEMSQDHHIKACVAADPDFNPESVADTEFVAYGDKVEKVVAILGAVATAASVPGFDGSLDGTFDGYRNTAQLNFDEMASPEGIEKLKCQVKAENGGFHLRMVERPAAKVVTSVIGSFDAVTVTSLLGYLEELQTWVAKCARDIETGLKAARTATAAA
jgi:hypothetical protein